MKSKELKTYNLPKEDVLISEIDAKPQALFLFLILIGALSFLFKVPSAYGIVTILISLGAMIYMPKVEMVGFYQDYLVLYNRADRNNCVLIYYDEVASWYYSWSASRDYLCIEMEDGTTEKIEAFSKTLFEAQMNRFLKDKHRKAAR
ncbi:MAG: hypothetical protein II577_04855 [Erysipelotrichaceae bacterium]|jgi:hypothetical protein|nr:hypothetical protein [Erysipelotrichaceae bacterium]